MAATVVLVGDAGFTALHYAVEGGSLDIVGVLLYNSPLARPPPALSRPDSPASDASSPLPTSLGIAFTPLHLAAQRGHAELVAYLLKADFAVDAADPAGRTPLHYAALAGRRMRGGDPPEVEGAIPASVASALAPTHSQAGGLYAAAAEVLLSAGADPHSIDNEGVAVIHMASGELASLSCACMRSCFQLLFFS